MVEFKKFVAIYLTIIVAVSALVISRATLLNRPNQATEAKGGHFSVVWKGFLPSYNNKTPDYYICINDLKPTILTMKIALRIKNFEDRGYYFRVDGYALPQGWTATPFDYGFVAPDETADLVYPNLKRQKPTSIPQGIMHENVTLVVKAYRDIGYTDLYSQDTFDVWFHFIDLTSSAWAVLYYDNFDDGTTQGWSYVNSYGSSSGSLDTNIDHYRSWPRSLRLGARAWYSYPSYYSSMSCYSKTYNTFLGYSEIYLIYSLKSEKWPTDVSVYINDVKYFQTDAQPSNNVWYRFALPLWQSTSLNIKIYAVMSTTDPSQWYYSYLDDVYIIAK